MGMAYTHIRYFPSAPLNWYIDYFYYLEGTIPYACEKILPFPVLDLKFNLGGNFTLHAAEAGPQAELLTESWWVGLYTRHHVLEWPSHLRTFGVRVKPDGAYPFVQRPLSELLNRVVPLQALWGRCAAETREQLGNAPSVQAGFVLLERALLARLSEAPRGLEIVRYAVKEIARSHGTLSIRALSDRIGISQNHLNSQFKRLVGTPPKYLGRLYRFEHVLRSIDPACPVDWALIAQESGYYDQSHCNKDYVAFTGRSPSAYLRARRRVLSGESATCPVSPRPAN